MHIEENKMFTIEEYEKLQHKYKYNIEFINGDVVLHSKTSAKHNEIVNNIQFKLMSYLANSKCKVYTEQIELKFHNDKDTINVFPDVFVMCEDAKKVGESFISPPKIIFEVVSPNYSGHDYITKLQIYQRYGVLEYVIVEQTGEMIQYNLVDGVFKPSVASRSQAPAKHPWGKQKFPGTSGFRETQLSRNLFNFSKLVHACFPHKGGRQSWKITK